MPDTIAFASVTPRLSLPLLFVAQAGKELCHNEALARIDALLHAAIQDEADAPPPAAQDGECWLVGARPEGSWRDHAGEIAIFQAGAWLFAAPAPGMRLFNQRTGQFILFHEAWQKGGEPQEPTGGLYVDSEARTAIATLISDLRASGIYPSA
jgi:hypothetical protein